MYNLQAQAELKAKEEAELRAQEDENQRLLQQQQQLLQGQSHDLQGQQQLQGQIQGQQVQGYPGQPQMTHGQSEQNYHAEAQLYAGQTHVQTQHSLQQAQYHNSGQMNGELVAGIPDNHLPVLETTREEIEAINNVQAGIDQALAVAVGSMNNSVSDSSMSHIVNSVTDVSKSSGTLLTPPSVSVSNWTESKFSETVNHQAEASDKTYTNIKDEIPSSDNDDFGGDTDDDLSYLDLSNTTESTQVLITPEKTKSPEKPKSQEKPKQPADKPKGKGSKRGRKGKGKVKEEMSEPAPLDTSKEQVRRFEISNFPTI